MRDVPRSVRVLAGISLSEAEVLNDGMASRGGGSVQLEMDFKTFVEIIDVYVQCRVK